MNILEKEGINPSTLGLLHFLKINTGKEGYILDIIRQYLFEFTTESGRKPHEILEEAGYIKYIKTGKKDPWFRVRLSEKGEKILKEMTQKPPHELAEFMLNYIKKQYERIGAEERYIRGGDKLLHYISEWLEEKQSYTEKMIKAVVNAYISQYEYDKTYLNSMATLIFKPTNVYATKFKSEDSPLWTFTTLNQDLIKYHYKLLQ